MFLLKQILPATVMAMMVAAGVCSLALFWGKERAHGVLGPLAIGIAYGIGHLFVVGPVSFPPADTTNWLPYLALAAAVLGASSAASTIKAWARVLIFALVSVGALRLLLRPKFQYGWSLGEGWVWVACLGSAIVLLAIILDALTRRSVTAIEIPAYLLIICTGTMGALMLSGSVLLGQLAAVLGAAVFGSLVLIARQVGLDRGIVPVFSLLTSALLVSGYFFAALPATSAALLAFAPVPALIPVGTPGRFSSFGIRAGLVAIPVAVAVTLAFLSSPPLDY